MIDFRPNLRFNEKEVQYLLKQIIEGMLYMSQKRILHKDLKLDNILIHFPKANEDDDMEDWREFRQSVFRAFGETPDQDRHCTEQAENLDSTNDNSTFTLSHRKRILGGFTFKSKKTSYLISERGFIN